MKIEIPHQHNKEEAKNRIKKLLDGLKEKFAGKITNVNETWNENSGVFGFTMGPFSTSGTIDVKEKAVEINLDIPFIASLYKNQIRSVIEEQAKDILS